MLHLPHIGHGVGLRTPHYSKVIAERPVVDWFEVIAENFMVEGGNPRRVLQKVREHYPVVLHGVSLSLGSVDPLNEHHLGALKGLAEEVEPPWISDHLSWGSLGGHYLHDLLPLPYTEEALVHVSARVAHVQERLGRQILIENVSSYLSFKHSTMCEWEFLTALTERTDCGLLLDVNNVFVSAHNQSFSGREFLDGIPVGRVGQIHLAGHTQGESLFIDTHDHPICDGVWALYRDALTRFGVVSTLIERDDHIPPLAELVAESHRAKAIAEAMHSGTRVD